MKTESYSSRPEGMIPNNRYPLLVHRSAIPGGGIGAIKAQFRKNGWSNNWHNPGVYSYPHFHSTTHECLGCASGWMDINLSVGDGGWTKIRIEIGDVILMPAGVSHEDLGHSEDNVMCGGYPDGRVWDNVRQEFLSPDLYYQACKSIMSLPIPDRDPATGKPVTHWLEAAPSDDVWEKWRDGLEHRP